AGAAPPGGHAELRLARRRAPRRGVPPRALAGGAHPRAHGALALADATRGAPRQRVLAPPHDRGGRPVPRDLRDDDPGARTPADPGRRARRARALAVLLGHGDPLLVPG